MVTRTPTTIPSTNQDTTKTTGECGIFQTFRQHDIKWCKTYMWNQMRFGHGKSSIKQEHSIHRQIGFRFKELIKYCNCSVALCGGTETRYALKSRLEIFLISNFHRVFNIVCVLLGISPASECDLPSRVLYTQPLKMEQRVPKRRQITIWRRGNTQKNKYKIGNNFKVLKCVSEEGWRR
jgi:hypothetical protein